jgi:hypothetical protein
MRRAALCGVVLAAVVATAALGQLVPQSAKLTGAGEIGQGRFGVSVALSADGNTTLIGGNTDNNTATFGIGAAWVFTRTGSSWAPQGAKLTASDGVGLPAFGYDVALSADGNTALIGGPGDHGNIGAVWTFTRSGGTWSQQSPKLTATGEVGAGRFGTTVALSADGTTAVVGAPNDGGGRCASTSAPPRAGVQQGPALVGSDGMGFVFLGENLALSADGSTILASGENENSATGAAWVFARSDGTWSQHGEKLTVATSGSFPRFGAGLALSADGNLALIGASREAGVGGFWQFARSGSTWTQVGTKVTRPTPPRVRASGPRSRFPRTRARRSSGAAGTARCGGPHGCSSGRARRTSSKGRSSPRRTSRARAPSSAPVSPCLRAARPPS